MKLTPSEKLIVRLLQEEGPSDGHQIAEATGISYRSLYASKDRMLGKLRTAGLIHVSDYRRQEGHGGEPAPIYKAGGGKDAARPPPLTKKERNARAKRVMKARNPKHSIISIMLGTAKARPQGIGPKKSDFARLFGV